MHKILSVLVSGSVGDLGKIAQALQDNAVNIDAIGGGEGDLNGTPVGIISMLVTSDEHDGAVSEIIANLDLNGLGHTPVSAIEHHALDLELDDTPGSLAAATSLLGSNLIEIMGVMTVDVHVGWGIVSLGFQSETIRDEAGVLLTNGGFNVMEPHGGRERRHEIDAIIRAANP
jgi:hypothetical protein